MKSENAHTQTPLWKERPRRIYAAEKKKTAHKAKISDRKILLRVWMYFTNLEIFFFSLISRINC